MKNKHIKKYSDFLFEQDMAAPPMMPGAPPAPGTPGAPGAKQVEYTFIFMTGPEDAGTSRRKYPDGSVVIEYPCYSIKKDKLLAWIKENVISSEKNDLNKPEIEVRQKSLEDIIKGDRTNTSDDDLQFIEKLKNAVSANLIAKKLPDVTVVFSNGIPTTDEIEVTFVKHKK
jgi:hypothetical protein